MRRHGRLGLVLCLLFALSAAVCAEARISLGPERGFLLRIAVTVKNKGGEAKEVVVKAPALASKDMPPYQSFTLAEKDNGRVRTAVDEAGRATFNFGTVAARSQVSAELVYRLAVRPISYHLPWFSRSRWPALPPEARAYLPASEDIEAGAPEIAAMAAQAVGNKKDPAAQAKALYAATNQVLTYDANAGRMTALETLKRRRASCEGYARLFAALGRARGIPVRLVYGLRLTKSKRSTQEKLMNEDRHVWDEAYLAGLGWIVVDPTFTYTVNGAKQVSYDYFARITEDDLHLFMGYQDQRITWTYLVPSGHPGLDVSTDLYLKALD